MALSYEQQNKKSNCIKKLKNVQKFEFINRLLCYACVLPFFHTVACLGQQKEAPLISKVGGAGFILSIAGVVGLKNKEDQLSQKIEKIVASEKERR